MPSPAHYRPASVTGLWAVGRVFGVLLVLFSFTMLIPCAVSLGYRDGEAPNFLLTFAITLTLGLLLWFPLRNVHAELRTRDGFVIVALFWIVLGLLSALPFVIGPHLGYTDSVFEAVSAFTTTGATTIIGLDALPRSILYYRQQLQFFGGMGVIVLAVAVLPLLGIGGMQLYRAETPGPMKEEKLTPRIAHTARALWFVYVGLTGACAFAYWLAGMSPFDAIGHGFATVSTGGFSTHDASMGYFQSPLIEGIAALFMLLGASNFGLLFVVWQKFSLRALLDDAEARAFLGIVLAVTGIETGVIAYTGHSSLGEGFRQAFFHVISCITSTGFTTTDFSAWPLFLPTLLVFVGFVGGCGGSTAGGLKVLRVVLLFRTGLLEVRRLFHPRLVASVKLGDRVVPQRIMDGVWGFFALYVAVFAVLMLAVMSTGVDQVTAFSGVATCINNMGPGLGEVSANFVPLSASVKWLLVLAMWLGRLEMFTILVLLAPTLWRV